MGRQNSVMSLNQHLALVFLTYWTKRCLLLSSFPCYYMGSFMNLFAYREVFCILAFPLTGSRPKECFLFSGEIESVRASSALSSFQKAQWISEVLSLKLCGLCSSFLTVNGIWRNKRTFSTILTHGESKTSSKFPWTSIITRLDYRERTAKA